MRYANLLMCFAEVVENRRKNTHTHNIETERANKHNLIVSVQRNTALGEMMFCF